MQTRLPLLALLISTSLFSSLLHAQGWSHYTTPYSFTTLAGATSSKGYADGSLSAARFNFPQSVALDGNGNIFVDDAGNDVIRKIGTNGYVSTVAGKVGGGDGVNGVGTNAIFNSPAGIVVDTNGNLFVADFNSFAIRKIDTNGVVSTFAGTIDSYGYADGTGTNARFWIPQAIAISGSGVLYVLDSANNDIRMISTNGVVTTLAGNAQKSGHADGVGTQATFNMPSGITVDASDNVYVADHQNYTIRKIDSNGVVTTIAGTPGVSGNSDGVGTNARFASPESITIGADGIIYVVDEFVIRAIDSNNNVTTIAGGGDGTSSDDGNWTLDGTGTNASFQSFQGPQGIAEDGQGNLIVADGGNNVIRKIDASDVVTTLAGGKPSRGSSDGTGTSARFYGPNGVAVDNLGNVFVADTGNNIIREIDSSGVVTTIAGQAGIGGAADGVGTNATFFHPEGIALDDAGNIYVADTYNGAMRMIDTTGYVSTIQLYEPNGDGTGFSSPSIALDGRGNLYEIDFNQIVKIDSNDVVRTLAGQEEVKGHADGVGSQATFNNPQGLAVDNAGNVYVADSGNLTIRKITPSGVVSTLAGKAGVPIVSSLVDGTGSNARFEFPTSVAVDRKGNLFVTDSGISTIRMVTPAGAVSTVAGQLGSAGSSDGVGAAAHFSGPQGIAVDKNGTLFVADSGNNEIRKGFSSSSTTQSIKFGALAMKVFGDSSFNLNAADTAGLPVSFSSSNTNVAEISGNTVTIAGAGTTTLTASQSGNSTFSAATPVNQVLVVAKASQLITFGAIPTQTFGASSLSLSASSPSLSAVSFMSSNKKVATLSGSTVTIVGAGLTTITASVPASANYNASTAHQVLRITKAVQSISFTTPSTEGFVKGQTFSLSGTAEGGPVAFKSNKPGVISVKGATASIQGKGNVTITATQSGGANYQAAIPVSVSVTVQ